jgi:carbon-monoxide dehydrogenase large subunit
MMDYALPRADDLPSILVETVTGTPCTHNPLGVKGCGEAGAIGAPAAVMNAITDALWSWGVRELPMPASPYNVWKAIHESEGSR